MTPKQRERLDAALGDAVYNRLSKKILGQIYCSAWNKLQHDKGYIGITKIVETVNDFTQKGFKI